MNRTDLHDTPATAEKTRRNGSRRRYLAALLALCLCTTGLTSAQAQEPKRLSEGDWQGVLDIDRVVVGSVDGADYTFTASLDGNFSMLIVNETSSEEETNEVETVSGVVQEGSWEASGAGEFQATISDQGEAHATWDIDFPIGQPSGFADAPLLTGDGDFTNIHLTVDAAGDRVVDTTAPDQVVPTDLSLELDVVSCSEAYGVVTILLSPPAGGSSGTAVGFDGTWTAYVDQEATRLAIREWTQDMRTAALRDVRVDSDLPGIAQMAAAVTNAYNAWAEDINQNDVDGQRTVDLINDAALLLNRFRNLTECEAELFSDDQVTKFETLGKRILLNLGTALAASDMPAKRLWQLYNTAAAAGAVGAASPQPEGAAFEEALRARVEQILAEKLILGTDDGTGLDGIKLDKEARTALAFGAQMNFQVEFNGKTVAVRDLWAGVAYEEAFDTEEGD